jgi:hypothetical protein
MKPFITTLICLVSLHLSAQNFKGMDKSPLDIAAYPSSYQVSDKAARVIYSRPQLKGRDLNDLAPAGKVWRTGANETTEIGDTTLPEGTYSIFTIPGEDSWTLILNKAQNTWGAYSYDDNLDVVRISAPVTSASESLEAFSIALEERANGMDLHMGWGTVRVAFPILF